MTTWQCRWPACAWHGRWYECPWDGFLYLCCPRCGGICDPVWEDGARPRVDVWCGSFLGLLLGLVVVGHVWPERPAETFPILMLVVSVVVWIGWGLLLTRE